jgi:hypothetical protein
MSADLKGKSMRAYWKKRRRHQELSGHPSSRNTETYTHVCRRMNSQTVLRLILYGQCVLLYDAI